MKPVRLMTAAALGLILSLGACASRSSTPAAPTVADMMEQSAIPLADEVSARRALAEQWREGDQMIAAGERQERDAVRDIRRAQNDIRDAERQVKRHQDRLTRAQRTLSEAQQAEQAGRDSAAQGRRLKAAAEADFRASYPGASLN
ncbi:hypothetical protein [Hyphomonas sp.]|uniref:hypothetical protein n=1 Tax=Hyphomonas sp. TaxID=87 RepID=UPI00391D5871